MVARRNVTQLWGAVNPPSVEKWKADLDGCMVAEKVVYESRGCPRKWNKIWCKWNVYRGNLCTDSLLSGPEDEDGVADP